MYFQFYFYFLLLCATNTLSDKLVDELANTEWYCANENCTEPIAIAKSTKNYPSNHHLKINLKPHDEVNILGKPKNKKGDLWLVSLGDKLGVVSKTFLLESRTLISETNCTVTKFDFTTLPGYEKAKKTVPPDIKPSPAHVNVIQGTTIYGDVSNANSYDVPHSDTDLTTENVTNSTDTIPVKVDELNNGQNKNDTISVPNILPTSGSVSESNETDTSMPTSISPTSPLDSKNMSYLISKDTITEPNNSKANEFLDVIGPRSNSFDGAVQSDQPSAGSDGSNIESVASKENMDISSQDNEGKLESNFQNESISESKAEALTENLEKEDLEVKNPEEISTTLKLKTSNTQSELDATKTFNLLQPTAREHNKLLPSSTENLATSPNTQSIFVPNELSDIKANNSSNENAGINSTETSENLKEIKQTTPPISSLDNTNLTADVMVNSNVAVGTTHFAVKKESSSETPASTESDKSFTPPSKETSTETPALTESDQSFTPPSKETSTETPALTESDKSYTPLIKESSTETPALTESDKSYTPPTKESSTETPALIESDKSYTPPTKESSTETPALTESDKSYTSPSASNFQNSAPNVFPYVSSKMSDVGTNIHKNTGSSTEQTNYEHMVTTPELNIDKLENNSNEASETISFDNDTKSLDASLEQLSGIPLDEPDNNLPTEDSPEESTNWFSSSSVVKNTVEKLLAKSDLDTNGNYNDQNIPENSNLNMISDKEEKEEDQPIEESNDAHKEGNIFEQSSEHILEKVDEYFGSLTMPSLVGPSMSLSTFMYLTLTSVVILLFSLGYYYLENMKHAAEYIGKINSLSAELFFAQKELLTMEEKLSKSSENFDKMVSNTASNEEALLKMKQEFEESEAMKDSLELENKRLKKEIDSLVESGNEMHRMLAESITDDERTQSLLANIEDLKTVLSDRLEEIASLTDQLDREKQEVELLTIALQKTEEKKEHIEEKIEKLMNDIDSKALSVANEFEEKVTSLEKIIEESSLERTNFEKEMVELKHKYETLLVEKELAEKALKKAQGIGPGKALSEWLDSKAIRTELISTQKEVEKLQRELEDVKNQNTKLLERETNFHSEIEILNNNYETAEKNKIEALTKLQVLSNYFNEKETQLQEELGTKEAQWLQKQSEDHSIYEQMRSLREENLSYRAQNDALKKEILDQEASFKIQIANEEQKAQENWVTLRHTERRLKEAQMETAHLRSRLTVMETNPQDTLDDKHAKSLELVNGEVPLGAASPPFMLYPPDFIPLPPLVSPSRPPPLGRLSSPPLTPPPPLSPYDIYSPPSPPPPLRVHKLQPREPPTRKQKDSQSSNHSSESIEKPVRRGKR